eukprot:SAG31_NODE_296_length_18227_cov_39.663173_2_plen_1132_part_00
MPVGVQAAGMAAVVAGLGVSYAYQARATSLEQERERQAEKERADQERQFLDWSSLQRELQEKESHRRAQHYQHQEYRDQPEWTMHDLLCAQQDFLVLAIGRLLTRLENASSPVWSESSAAGVALCVAAMFGDTYVLRKVAVGNQQVRDILDSPHRRMGLVCTRVSHRSAKVVSEWLQDLAWLRSPSNGLLARSFPMSHSFTAGLGSSPHFDEVQRVLSALASLLQRTSQGEHSMCVLPSQFGLLLRKLGFNVTPLVETDREGHVNDKPCTTECFFRTETWHSHDVHKSELLCRTQNDPRWRFYGHGREFFFRSQLQTAYTNEVNQIMGLSRSGVIMDGAKQCYILERPAASVQLLPQTAATPNIVVANFPQCCFEVVFADTVHARASEVAALSGPQTLITGHTFGKKSYSTAASKRGVYSTGLAAPANRRKTKKPALHKVTPMTELQQKQCTEVMAQVWSALQAHLVLARCCICKPPQPPAGKNTESSAAGTEKMQWWIPETSCSCGHRCSGKVLCPGQLKGLRGSTLEHCAALSGSWPVAEVVCEMVAQYRVEDTKIIDNPRHRRRLERAIERNLLDSTVGCYGAAEVQAHQADVRAFCSEFVTMVRSSFAVSPVNAAGLYPHDLVASSTTHEDSAEGFVSFGVSSSGESQLRQRMYEVKKGYEEDKEAHIAAASMSVAGCPAWWHRLALVTQLCFFSFFFWVAGYSLLSVMTHLKMDLGRDAGAVWSLWLLACLLLACMAFDSAVNFAVDVHAPHVRDLRPGTSSNNSVGQKQQQADGKEFKERMFERNRRHCKVLERVAYDFVSKLRGWESSTAADLKALQTRCEAKLREWEGRRIQADIQRHVKTKLIDTDELRWLLSDMAEAAMAADEFAAEIEIELPEQFLEVIVTQPTRKYSGQHRRREAAAHQKHPHIGQKTFRDGRGSARARITTMDVVGDACDICLDHTLLQDDSEDEDEDEDEDDDGGRNCQHHHITADSEEIEEVFPNGRYRSLCQLQKEAAPIEPRFPVGFPVRCLAPMIDSDALIKDAVDWLRGSSERCRFCRHEVVRGGGGTSCSQGCAVDEFKFAFMFNAGHKSSGHSWQPSMAALRAMPAQKENDLIEEVGERDWQPTTQHSHHDNINILLLLC